MKGRKNHFPARGTPESAERLIRSLVGVAQATVTAAPDGTIRAVAITPDEGASGRQVVYNVVSALLAGCGISIDASCVTVSAATQPDAPQPAASAPDEPAWPSEAVVEEQPRMVRDHRDRPEPEPEMIEEAPRPLRPGSALQQNSPAAAEGAVTLRKQSRLPPPASRPVAFRPGKAIAHTGAVALAAVEESMPEAAHSARLETVELWRVDDQLRCRVIVAVGSDRFTGVAAAPDLPGAALELPARVTTDALRTARIPPAPFQLEGVAFAEVGGRTHVVASMQLWTGQEFEPVAGAALVGRSVEEAAALAVLRAVKIRP